MKVKVELICMASLLCPAKQISEWCCALGDKRTNKYLVILNVAGLVSIMAVISKTSIIIYVCISEAIKIE